MKIVTTLFSNLFLFLGSLFFGALSVVVSQFPPHADRVRPCARGWARGLLWSSGCKLRVRSESELDPRRGYIFMANHQSVLDIPAMILSMPGQFRFLAKRSLFKLPVFGWSLSAAGFIPVDRGQGEHAKAAFEAALAALQHGASLIIYPEETRSFDGRLREFKRGGFLMALKTGVPIVPVGIRGTRDSRPRGTWIVRPAQVEVCFGPVIDPADFGMKGRRELVALATREVSRLSGCPMPDNTAEED